MGFQSVQSVTSPAALPPMPKLLAAKWELWDFVCISILRKRFNIISLINDEDRNDYP
jgi:hypothetical protein